MKPPADKVVDLAALRKERERWDREGKTVVLAAGSFEIFTIGHLRYLEDAARRGDVLVVAVFDDRAVESVRGPGRPLIPEGERAEMTAYFRVVDRVIIIPETNPVNLAKSLKPDVYAADFEALSDADPAQEVVEGYGGKSVIAGDPAARPTKDVISAVKLKHGKR